MSCIVEHAQQCSARLIQHLQSATARPHPKANQAHIRMSQHKHSGKSSCRGAIDQLQALKLSGSCQEGVADY
jgi:hypothetical protein